MWTLWFCSVCSNKTELEYKRAELFEYEQPRITGDKLAVSTDERLNSACGIRQADSLDLARSIVSQ
jgi:hypothetical protein